MIACLFLTLTLAAISAIDWRSHRIPDRLSLPLLAGGLAWNSLAGPEPFATYLIGAVAGYASLALFGALYFGLRKREGLGLGDAKLFAAAGAWLGWRDLPFVLLAASLGGLAFALITRRLASAPTHQRIAFGPWISVGILILWFGRSYSG
jgi:leader peptidase (prepilin peptidase)/N-methyltransferase